MERAKEIFLTYHGNRYYMDLDGVGSEYDRYHVSKETEALWTKECVSRALGTVLQGREALRAYAAAADLLGSDRQYADWEKCLYYPLRAEHLDDITVLFMLPVSFRMAEHAAGKKAFSRNEAQAYIKELERYSQQVRERSENGTLTRSEDYVQQEFSDPVYIAGYLDDLIQKWARQA